MGSFGPPFVHLHGGFRPRPRRRAAALRQPGDRSRRAIMENLLSLNGTHSDLKLRPSFRSLARGFSSSTSTASRCAPAARRSIAPRNHGESPLFERNAFRSEASALLSFTCTGVFVLDLDGEPLRSGSQAIDRAAQSWRISSL